MRLRAIDDNMNCTSDAFKSSNAPKLDLVAPQVSTNKNLALFTVRFPVEGYFQLCLDTPESKRSAARSIPIGALLVRSLDSFTTNFQHITVVGKPINIHYTGFQIPSDLNFVIIDSEESCGVDLAPTVDSSRLTIDIFKVYANNTKIDLSITFHDRGMYKLCLVGQFQS